MTSLLEFGTTPFNRLLPDHLQRALGSAAITRLYANGELIHGRGDSKPGLSIVRRGAVRMCNVGSDGSLVTTAVLGPDQAFGEFTVLADLPRTHDAIALGSTTVDQVSRQAFERLAASRPELIRILAAATARRLHAVLELLDDLRRLPLPVLTAKLLLTMLQQSSLPGTVECNQTDLADTLGVSRVSIGKALKHLEAANLIEKRYRRILVADVRLLQSWIAERDYLFRLEA